MKKLTKTSIDDLQKMMPVLDEETQRLVLGGGESNQTRTDCFFLCMNELRKSFSGEKVNYEGDYYMQRAEDSGNFDEWGNGMDPQYADSFMSGYFSFDVDDSIGFMLDYEMHKDFYSGLVQDGSMSEKDVPNFMADKNLMAISNDGTHAVIITGYNPTSNGYIYFDPQTNTSGIKNVNDVSKIYNVYGMNN